jgi:hypothetical protein
MAGLDKQVRNPICIGGSGPLGRRTAAGFTRPQRERIWRRETGCGEGPATSVSAVRGPASGGSWQWRAREREGGVNRRRRRGYFHINWI